MKPLNILLVTLFFTFSIFGQNITATTENGKKVVLKPDNTWEYVKEEPKPEPKTSGNDYEAAYLFAEKNKDKLNKSEYESEDQYKDRLIELFSALQTPFVFEVKNHNLTYDAETERFLFASIDTSSNLDFVEREGSLTSEKMIFQYFPVPRADAKAIKENAEILVYGFPIYISANTDKYYRSLKVIPLRFEIKNKLSGAIVFQKSLPSFFFADEDKSESDQSKSPGYTSPSTQSTPGTDVRVKGYYRRDGTYVRPHTRSAPKRKN